MCCGADDSEHEGGQHPHGPVKKRRCTDIVCCIVFIVYIGGMVAFGILGYLQGDPRKLLLPKDSEGRICGLDDQVGKENLHFFDITKCIREGVTSVAFGCPTPQVCVAKCPQDYTYYLQLEVMALLDGHTARSKLVCKSGVNVTTDQRSISTLVKSGACAAYTLNSTAVLNRCVPNAAASAYNTVFRDSSNSSTSILSSDGSPITGALLQKAQEGLAKIQSLQEIGEKVLQDVYKSWKFILAIYGGGMVFCVIWIVLLRFIFKVIIMAGCILALGLLAFGAYFCISQYASIKNGIATSQAYQTLTNMLSTYVESQNLWLAIGIVTAVVGVILILIFIFLVRRVCVALELLSEGSKAIGKVMTTLLWPLFPYALQVATILYWGAATLYIASSGGPLYQVQNGASNTVCPYTSGQPCNPKTFNTNKQCSAFGTTCVYSGFGYSVEYPLPSYMPNFRAEFQTVLVFLNKYQWIPHVYNLFGMFWLWFFFDAVNQCVLAGVFATYYWAFDKSKDMPRLPLCRAIGRALGFHMGSLALGSLLVAMLRMIRVLLEYIDHKTKKSKNCCAQCLLKCLKCCFWCLEKCLRFLNKNAYIMMAIYGTGFCASAAKAIGLLLKNILKTIIIDKVTGFILFVNKLMVVAGVGVASWYFFSGAIPLEEIQSLNPQLNFPIVAVVLIVIGTYVIASCFFSVYDMAVDTLYLCFLEDLEVNDGSEAKPYFMPKTMRLLMGKMNQVASSHPTSAGGDAKKDTSV